MKLVIKKDSISSGKTIVKGTWMEIGKHLFFKLHRKSDIHNLMILMGELGYEYDPCKLWKYPQEFKKFRLTNHALVILNPSCT